MKIFITILFCVFSANAIAADNVKLDAQHQIIQNAISQIDSNLSAEGFEKVIQSKYLSTYHFLNKLPKSQKREVYEYYKSESDFSVIRHKIFDLFFGVSQK